MLQVPGLLSYLGILPVVFKRTPLIKSSSYLVFLALGCFFCLSLRQYKVTVKGFFEITKSSM